MSVEESPLTSDEEILHRLTGPEVRGTAGAPAAAEHDLPA